MNPWSRTTGGRSGLSAGRTGVPAGAVDGSKGGSDGRGSRRSLVMPAG